MAKSSIWLSNDCSWSCEIGMLLFPSLLVSCSFIRSSALWPFLVVIGGVSRVWSALPARESRAPWCGISAIEMGCEWFSTGLEICFKDQAPDFCSSYLSWIWSKAEYLWFSFTCEVDAGDSASFAAKLLESLTTGPSPLPFWIFDRFRDWGSFILNKIIRMEYKLYYEYCNWVNIAINAKANK